MLNQKEELKLEAMTDKQYAIRDDLKKIECRMATLDEHIRHSGNFKGYRAHKAQYDKLYAHMKPLKKQRASARSTMCRKPLMPPMNTTKPTARK